jgi:hypothetical protein
MPLYTGYATIVAGGGRVDCSMNIDVDLNERYETVVEAIVSSELEQVCGECKRIIEEGEKYEVYVGLDGDRKNHVHITCADCRSVVKGLFGCFTFGDVWDTLEDEVREINGEVPEACLKGLTKTAREKLCDIIEEVWEDLNEEDEV